MKQVHWFVVSISFLSIALLLSPDLQAANGQFQDLSCPSCVDIPSEEIDLYKSLFPLTIWTDDQTYDHNSIVNLNGHLRPSNSLHPVTITVTNPIGNIVTIEQITPSDNGDFSLTFNTGSSLWSKDGDYIIKAQSGSDARIFKTKVQIISLDLGSKQQCEITEVTILADNGGTYCIPFKALGETTGVEGTLSTVSKTMTIDIRGKGIDSLELQIPRGILDAKSSGGDDSDFLVLLKGEPIDYEEIETTPSHRVILIKYPPDRTGQIDIVGTSVIPEFGTIAILIFATAITSIMIITKRSNFITPKF